MPRVKIKHPSPNEENKRNLLCILAQHDVYVTRIELAWDGFAVITSSEKEVDNLFETTCLTKLEQGQYSPNLPAEQKSKRTVLLYGVEEFIRKKPAAEIKEEIYRVNDFTVGYIDAISEFSNILKITFTQTAPAHKCKDIGLKMFNMRVPHHQVKEQDYTPITTCMRCYAVDDHYTNKCPKPKEYVICSECSSTQHKWHQCDKRNKQQCINCSEPHRTLAYKCPVRKQAVEKAKEKKKATSTTSKPYSAAAAAQPAAETQLLFSPEAAHKILTCLLQAHVMNIAEPGSFATVLNNWLEMNNLPKMNAPDNPDSFKLLRPGALIPQNLPPNTFTAPQEPATPDSRAEDEDDDDNSSEEDEQEEEEIDIGEDENTTEGNEQQQHTKTPPTNPSRPPTPQSPKSQSTKHSKQTSNQKSSTSHSPAPNNQNVAQSSPSTPNPNSINPSAKPKRGGRRKQ